MADKKVVYRSGGTGFCGLLAIVFITLKLCGVIDWSWLWVLGPLWIPLAVALILVTGVLLFAGACYAFEGIVMALTGGRYK